MLDNKLTKSQLLSECFSLKQKVTELEKSEAEHRQAEKALLQAEENFHRSLDESPLGVRIVSEEGETLYVNRAILDIHGYDSIEEYKNEPAVMHYTSESYTEFRIRREKRKRGDYVPSEYEISIVRKDAEIRTLQALRKEILWDGKKQFQVIYRDITEQKKKEAERQKVIQRLRKVLGSTIEAMAATVEVRDPYTAGHQRKVADLARSIATEMNLPGDQIDGVRMASLIHDIGKISVPVEILIKPAKLTVDEFELIKAHPQTGFEILKDIEFTCPIARIILEHHERMDGSGYPHGLRGEDILIESRILMVADVVETMSSHRPYRPGLGIDFALDEIKRDRGAIYDAAVVDACVGLFREKGYKLKASRITLSAFDVTETQAVHEMPQLAAG